MNDNLIFATQFTDTSSTNTHNLGTGNYLLYGFLLIPVTLQTLAGGVSLGRVSLKSTTLGTIYSQYCGVNASSASVWGLFQDYPVYWNNGLPIPRGDTLSVVTDNFSNANSFTYSVNIYGQSLV